MLKKLFSILLSVMLVVNVCAVTAVLAANTPANILVNGDFETFSNGTVDGWTLPANTTLDINGVNGGTTALKVVGRGQTTAPAPTNRLTYQYNRTYECKFYARADEADLKAGNTFYWYLNTADAKPSDNSESGYPDVTKVQELNTDGSWTLFTKTVKFVPAGSASQDATDFSCRLAFHEVAAAGNTFTPTVYFDDFSIVPKYYINTVEISGDDTASCPGKNYTAKVLNQEGTTDEVPQNVTWSISEPLDGVSITADGELIIDSTETTGSVTIRATSEEDYGCTAYGEFTVTIEEGTAKTEEERKALVDAKLTAAAIAGSNASLNAVTSNLNLAKSTGYDDITWYSDKTYVVNPDTGVVTRTDYDELVKLTAEYTIEDSKYTKTVDLCVLASDGTNNPGVAGNNLVPNGDMEDGTGIYGGVWSSHNSDEKYTGKYSAKTGTLGRYKHKAQIMLKEGATYRFSVMVKLGASLSSAGMNLQFRDTGDVILFKATTTVDGTKEYFGVSGNNWVKLTGYLTVPEGKGQYASPEIYLGTNDCYIDSVEVSELSDTNTARIYKDNDVSILSNRELTNAMAINKLLRPTAEDGSDVTMLVASYNADKQLLNCSLVTDTLTAGTAKNICAKLPANANTKYVKVFLWNKISVMKPLRDLETFEVPAAE